jgi:hypothetical protein
MSLRTSCWLLPQKEQYSVFLESLVPTLLIHVSVRRSTSLTAPFRAGTVMEMEIEQIPYQKRPYA